MEIEMELTSLTDCSAVNQRLTEKMKINTVIDFDVCIIENMCLRFPHLMEQINELLDNKSLMKCKEVSRTISSNIENQKSGTFLTKRVIQRYNKNTKKFAKEWKIVLKKLPSDRLNVFGNLVKEFHKAVPSRCEFLWCPISIAAERGHVDFCKSFVKMNILSKYECSKWPLYFCAQAGHLDIFKFLYNKIQVRHTTRILQIVQHIAAKNGHLDIYKFLHECSDNINPIMTERITPLHLAAQYGHFDVCKYICDNTMLVKPLRRDRSTPMTLAVHRGHIKIAKLLHERDHPKRRIAGKIFHLFVTLFVILIIINEPDPDSMNCLFWVILLVCCLICSFIKTVVKILLDIWFCRRISPILDY